jgi:hypothetical protein
LTEFAAALSFAQRRDIDFGGFLPFLESQAGGLKALVAAERDARRPEARTDANCDKARSALRQAAPIELAAISANEEFALVLTRRGTDGVHQAIAIVSDEPLLDRVIRRTAA